MTNDEIIEKSAIGRANRTLKSAVAGALDVLKEQDDLMTPGMRAVLDTVRLALRAHDEVERMLLRAEVVREGLVNVAKSLAERIEELELADARGPFLLDGDARFAAVKMIRSVWMLSGAEAALDQRAQTEDTTKGRDDNG